MAWHLHYTSAPGGPGGRSGFQFVGITPGTPPEVAMLVAPHMAYRPPPDAPPAPAEADLAGFPVALAHTAGQTTAPGMSVLVRCHYTGMDYSGRYGNFHGHALVATPAEMAGIRPIELWGSALWASSNGVVVPGADFDPESLADKPVDEGLLVVLLDAVARVLRSGGRIVLVSADVGAVARWIAVASYTLPEELAARLSFTTFSGDPDASPYMIVGTTPAAWELSARPHDPTFLIDEGRVLDGAEPGRFGRTAARLWHLGDFAGLDSLGELVSLTSSESQGADLDAAAALLRLSTGGFDAEVEVAEEAAVAGLLRKPGVPGWAWRGLAPERLGFDIALAAWTARFGGAERSVRFGGAERSVGFGGAEVPAEVVAACADRCVELALTRPSLRARLPDDLRPGAAGEPSGPLAGAVERALTTAGDLTEVCAVLALADRLGLPARDATVTLACSAVGPGDVAATLPDVPRQWREAFVTGVAAAFERAPEPPPDEVCVLLGDRDWSGAPRTGGAVLATLGRRAPERRAELAERLVRLDPPDAGAAIAGMWEHPPPPEACVGLLERLGDAPGLAALVVAVLGDAPLADPAALRLAMLVGERQGLRRTKAGTAARALLDYADTLRAKDDLPELLATIERRPGDMADRVFSAVARDLLVRGPQVRAELLVASSEPVRARLVGCWLRRASGDLEERERIDLAEIAVRLNRAGVADPALATWARSLSGKRVAGRGVRSGLAGRDPRLAEEWRRLGGARGTSSRGPGGRRIRRGD